MTFGMYSQRLFYQVPTVPLLSHAALTRAHILSVGYCVACQADVYPVGEDDEGRLVNRERLEARFLLMV